MIAAAKYSITDPRLIHESPITIVLLLSLSTHYALHPDFICYIFITHKQTNTHAHLRGLWLSALAALVASCLINLCKHTRLKRHGLGWIITETLTKVTFYSMFHWKKQKENLWVWISQHWSYLQRCSWTGQAYLSRKAAMLSRGDCTLFFKTHILLKEEETMRWKIRWDKADWGRAAALIAPCDSATGPPAYQLNRKQEADAACRRRWKRAAPGKKNGKVWGAFEMILANTGKAFKCVISKIHKKQNFQGLLLYWKLYYY